MFFRKNKVEEDLQRIKKANPPEEKLDTTDKKHLDDARLEKGDILAITLAIMSLVLPYILAFLGIMGGVMLLMKYLWS